MIRLTSTARPLAPSFLDERGGFAWWYVDVVDAEGNGAVIIWSFGLPFLPGYTDSARRGQAPPSRALPSINVVLYERGRPAFYLLQRLPEDDAAVSVDGRVWRFGRTIIHTDDEPDGQRRVTLALDLDVPNSLPLRGSVVVRGWPRRASAGEAPSDGAVHEWCPLLAHAHGEVDVTFDRRAFRMQGEAYHDRNGSPLPIDALGISRWTWGRAQVGDRLAIWYLLWPEAPHSAPRFLGLEMESDGTTHVSEQVEVLAHGLRRDRWGMRRWDHLELRRDGAPWLDVAHASNVDRGPFYLREQVRVRTPDGTEARGWAEYVEPRRVDLARHRPLVRMRVHDLTRRNSFWLPLFAGSTDDRVRRTILRRPLGIDRALPLAPDLSPELRRAIRQLSEER